MIYMTTCELNFKEEYTKWNRKRSWILFSQTTKWQKYYLCNISPNTSRDTFTYSIPRSMSSGSWSSVFNFTTFLVCSDKLVTTAYVWLKKSCLRNRKHVPCFYRVIVTQVEVGRKKNAVGTRVAGECFHGCFKFSQTFTSVSITR